jgi:hypothetical protein
MGTPRWAAKARAEANTSSSRVSVVLMVSSITHQACGVNGAEVSIFWPFKASTFGPTLERR